MQTMIITLTGENAFALQLELHRLTDEFIAEHGDLALERVDGGEVEFSRLSEALTSLPFLATRKLVVLRSPSANKEFTEKAEVLIENISESIDVIIVEPKLDKRLSYYKFLKKSTDFREFPALDGYKLAGWLTDVSKARGGKLSQANAHYLVERVGANQQLLASELDKLLLYSANITRANIDLLTEATPQSTVFQLLEAAFAGNAKRTLELYKEQRALRVEPPQIVAMLTWQLHVLALIKTAGERSATAIASDARVSPFVVQKSQAVARTVSLSDLKELISDLLRIDIRSKREPLDIDEALQNYLLKIAP